LGQDFQATLWIGLDWIHELMDWIGLDQQTWTHVQLCINNPTNHGWKEEDGKLLPIWTTLPLAKDVFHLDVKCTCPIACS